MALKLIRDNLKSLVWILWVVIFALVALIFFQWGGYKNKADAVNQVAATVGSEEITFSQFQNAYRNLESRYREAFGEQFNRDMARQFNLPMQALNQLVTARILVMEARASGLSVSDDEVRQRILSLFQRNGKFVGVEEYERILRGQRLTSREFNEMLREDLLLAKLDSVLAAATYVTDEDVEQAYRDQVERAKIRYVELPAAQMDEVEVETSELEAYLADHPDEFEIPEKRVVDYILVDTNKLRQTIEITESELRSYYDQHQDQYKREEQVTARHILRKITPDRDEATARAEVEKIKQRIAGGEDFAAVAREMSEDEVSAKNGGMLRPFSHGQMVPEFEKAAFEAKTGELVGPVKSQFGFHLIETLAHTPAGLQPYEQVQASIRARLLSERATNLAQEKALDVAGRVTKEMSDEQVRALAEEEGLEVVTTEPFGVDDTVAGLGRSPDFNRAAFGLPVGGVSEPVRVPRGWAVLKLKEVSAPRSPALAEVEDKVREAVSGKRRKEAALARLRDLVAAGKSLDEIAGELGLEAKESDEFGRSGSIPDLPGSRDVVAAALALDTGELGEPLATDKGAVAFEVTERKKFDPAEFEAQKETTRAAQESERLEDLKRVIVEQRRRELETNFNPAVFKNFGIEMPAKQG